MLENYLLSNPWLAATCWAFLYVGDYCLTLWGARLFRAQQFVKIEGSYELNPDFQDDIDNQRPVSWRLVTWLGLGVGLLLSAGWVDHPPFLYGMLVGCFIFPELAVWMVHADNITTYRRYLSPDASVSGGITVTRRGLYRRSGVRLACLTVFTFVCYALSHSPTLLGGALALCALSLWRICYAGGLGTAARGTAVPGGEQAKSEEPDSQTNADRRLG